MTTSRKQKTNVKKKKKPVVKKITSNFADVSEERASIISVVRGLEGQVETAFRLKEILQSQLDTLQKRLSDEFDARAQSEVQLARRLEASEASKDALERELTETHENARTLREEVEQLREEVERLREKVTGSDGRTADLCILLEEQQATNRKLTEATARLENEIEMVNINYDLAKNELDAFKNAVHDIRSEATQTSGRVCQRYLKPDDAGNLNQQAKTKPLRKRSQPSSTKK
jgi:chromosome segregation ATPase